MTENFKLEVKKYVNRVLRYHNTLDGQFGKVWTKGKGKLIHQSMLNLGYSRLAELQEQEGELFFDVLDEMKVHLTSDGKLHKNNNS